MNDELDDTEIVKEITPRLQQQEQNILWEEGLRQMNDTREVTRTSDITIRCAPKVGIGAKEMRLVLEALA